MIVLQDALPIRDAQAKVRRWLQDRMGPTKGCS